MDKTELKKIISRGEDSRLQFKEDLRNTTIMARIAKGYSEAEIEAIQLALRHKKNLNVVSLQADSITVAQGPAIGAVWLWLILEMVVG